MGSVAKKKPFSHSLGLLGCAALWLVTICVWYANSHSKDAWSQTPLLWVIVLFATTVLCVAAGIALLRARHLAVQPLSCLDWCALLTGTVAMIVGSLLVIMVVIG
jgi:hypothetical protein